MLNPNTSILIPCYNAEQWIGEAIDSALAQTYPRTEVVVYDDGSTDSSLDIIKSYGDQIRWGTGPNRGGGPARNWLLEQAEGAWIQYLDADDYLKPDKIADQVAVLQDIDTPVDVLYGPETLQYHEGEEVHQEKGNITHTDDPWAALVTWDLPQTGAPLWRKTALNDVGGWKEDQPVCQEHELYLRLLMAEKKFHYADAGGAVYRQWSTNTVCRSDQKRTKTHQVEIVRRAEAFMMEHGLMTPERREILNNAYLSLSRMIWLFDPEQACAIMKQVDEVADGHFTPSLDHVPRAYTWLYKTLGFHAAEQVAAWKRRWVFS